MYAAKDANFYLRLIERVAGIGSWRVDLLANTLHWSEQVYTIHGVTPETYEPELESAIAFYHPDDVERVNQAVNNAINSKENFEFQLRIIRADNQVRWVRSKGECVLNEEGNVAAVNGIFQDITQQRELTRRLEESEDRFKLAIQGSKSGIWDWINVNGDEEWWSPQFYALLGYEDQEIPATLENFGKALHPDDTEHTFALVKQHFEGKADFDVEYRLQTKSGDYRWFQGYGVVRRDEQGNPTRMVGSITDIHERKERQRMLDESNYALQQKNKELDEFAYVASHDLKAPLRAIDNLTTWLMEDAFEVLSDTSKEHLLLLGKRVGRMERLLEDLLQYSRAGREENKIETVNCQELIGSVVSTLNIDEGATINVQTGLPEIDTQRLPLYQVFLNLIGNAIKHNDKEIPIIDILWNDNNDRITFTIKDNGPGISKQYHSRIFQIFQTLKPRDEVEGSGIGLSIVKKLVHSVGGQIQLDSTPGEGTSFIFSWPYKAVYSH